MVLLCSKSNFDTNLCNEYWDANLFICVPSRIYVPVGDMPTAGVYHGPRRVAICGSVVCLREVSQGLLGSYWVGWGPSSLCPQLKTGRICRDASHFSYFEV